MLDYLYNLQRSEELVLNFPEESVIRLVSAFEVYFKRYFEHHPKYKEYLASKTSEGSFQDIEYLKDVFYFINGVQINTIDEELWRDIQEKCLNFRHLTIHNASKNHEGLVYYISSEEADKCIRDMKLFIYKVRCYFKENDSEFNDFIPLKMTKSPRFDVKENGTSTGLTPAYDNHEYYHDEVEEMYLNILNSSGYENSKGFLINIMLEIATLPDSDEIIKKICEKELIFKRIIKWEDERPHGTSVNLSLIYDSDGSKMETKTYVDCRLSIIEEDVPDAFAVHVNLESDGKSTPYFFMDSLFIGCGLFDKKLNLYQNIDWWQTKHFNLANGGDAEIVDYKERKAMCLKNDVTRIVFGLQPIQS